MSFAATAPPRASSAREARGGRRRRRRGGSGGDEGASRGTRGRGRGRRRDARETVGSAWLPAPAARAFARLLWAEAVRPLGQFKEARRELEAALRECADALNVLGVLPEGGDPIEARKQEDAALMGVSPAASPVKKRKGKSREAVPPARAPQSRQWVGSEADLSLRTGADASPYLTIRLLALQSLVGIDLTSTKLDDAASRAEAMRTMVEAYPRTLRRTAAAADVVEGQTLHSLGREAEAAVRFAAAAETAEAFGAPATRDLACVCGALSGARGWVPRGDQPRAEPGATRAGTARARRRGGGERGGRGQGEGQGCSAQLRVPSGGAVRVWIRYAAPGRGVAGGQAQAQSP